MVLAGDRWGPEVLEGRGVVPPRRPSRTSCSVATPNFDRRLGLERELAPAS